MRVHRDGKTKIEHGVPHATRLKVFVQSRHLIRDLLVHPNHIIL